MSEPQCVYNALAYLTQTYLEKFERGEELDDSELEIIVMGGFLHDHGKLGGTDEEEKPYYDHVKKKLGRNEQQKEYNNEQLLLEDNVYYPQYEYIPQQYTYSYDYNNYYTPYSYEYDPYIDYYNNYNNGYNNTYYNDTVNTTVDLTNNNTNTFNNAITNVLDMIKSYKYCVNICKPVKINIIQYISNYRPIYNSITNKIEAVLIE